MSEDRSSIRDGTFHASFGPGSLSTLDLKMSGFAELGTHRLLGDLLRALHAYAKQRQASEVVVDLRQVTFLNSSCFKSLVTWLSEIQELPQPAQYRVKFLSNPGIRWQRASLHALSCFAVGLVQIESLQSP